MTARAAKSKHLGHAVVDLLTDSRGTMHASEIAQKLEVSDRAALSRALEDLVYDGLLVQKPGRRYSAVRGKKKRVELEGGFSAHPRGFGFVRAGTSGEDVYIPPECIAGAMHGDVVRARVVATSSRGREGEVMEVLERRTTRVVGVLAGRSGERRLLPDDGRIRGPIPIVAENFDDEPSARGANAKPGVAAVV